MRLWRARKQRARSKLVAALQSGGETARGPLTLELPLSLLNKPAIVVSVARCVGLESGSLRRPGGAERGHADDAKMELVVAKLFSSTLHASPGVWDWKENCIMSSSADGREILSNDVWEVKAVWSRESRERGVEWKRKAT